MHKQSEIKPAIFPESAYRSELPEKGGRESIERTACRNIEIAHTAFKTVIGAACKVCDNGKRCIAFVEGMRIVGKQPCCDTDIEMAPRMDGIVECDTKIVVQGNKALLIGYGFPYEHAFGIERIVFIFLRYGHRTVHRDSIAQ